MLQQLLGRFTTASSGSGLRSSARPFSSTALNFTRVKVIRQPKPQPDPQPMKLSEPMYKVTLHRSLIGMPQKERKSAHALGLRKRTQTIYTPQTKIAAGLILKIKELVKLENVTEILPPRTGGKGYEIIARANKS